MRKAFSREMAVIIVLVVAMVIAGLVLTDQSGSGSRTVGTEPVPNPSIYNDRASGTRGFFEWVGKLGRRADLSRTDWSDLPENAPMLVSIAPNVEAGGPAAKSDLSVDDAQGISSWVSRGHTLLLMASKIPGSVSVVGDPGAAFGQKLGIDIGAAISTSAARSEYFAPTAPLAVASGVNSVRIQSGARILRTGDDEITLFGTPPKVSGTGPVKGAPTAILFGLGQGHVIVIADDEFASNENLLRADNAVFLSNVIDSYTKPGDLVLFDEYHHGDIAGDSRVWQSLGRPMQLGLIQLGLAAVILLIVLAPRFGAPAVMSANKRRTSGEYVSSLAGLYRNAQAAGPALEIVYKQFLRDMCARLGLPPDVSLEQLADAAARRGNLNKAQLRRLLGNCERALDNHGLTESDLLELVRQMERFRKDLGID